MAHRPYESIKWILYGKFYPLRYYLNLFLETLLIIFLHDLMSFVEINLKS